MAAQFSDSKQALGVVNYHGLGGDMLHRLPQLPDPDRIFIGAGERTLPP